ncbi:uncharacterized protein LOC109949802 isoform X1 [Prunus persica]|uniref:uncharacterized protein LOC109949802 isoform X1 n=1 Tax=Prunus persica TaxID=3760 RepID=UPI0009AB49B3|nr:uncharacterized protein LOC109949802 isoform X1 [Prunus persica]
MELQGYIRVVVIDCSAFKQGSSVHRKSTTGPSRLPRFIVTKVLVGGNFGIEQITGETAKFSAGVKVEISIRRAIRSIVPDIRQVSDTHRVRLEFQSEIWFGSCHFCCYLEQKLFKGLTFLLKNGQNLP